jgi:uncharacterized hydrolase ycgS
MRATIETEKGIIEYSMFGKGETILFIHGGHSNCNETLFQKGFKTTEYQLLTPSRPGYGKTPLNFQNKSPKGTAELIISLLDKLKINSFKIIGISAGGLTALELAANYPERVNHLVLISALTKKWFKRVAPTYRKGKIIFSPRMEKFSWAIYNILLKFFPRLMTKVMFKELSKYRPIKFEKDEIEELKEMTIKMRSLQGFSNDLEQDIDQNILNKIKCKTLILHSNYDNSVGFEHPENAKRKIKQAELIMFNNRWGHLLWLGKEYKEPLTEIEKQWKE